MIRYKNYIRKLKINEIVSSITEKVQTVFNEKIEKDNFVSINNLFDTKLEINIQGIGVERSYEDRSVYFNLNFLKKEIQSSSSKLKLEFDKTEIETWINGEDAIKMGQILIKHGVYSLESNMINHQKIHHYSQLKKFLDDDIIDKVEITKLDKKVLYGSGYFFNIKPIWKNKGPKYQEDFNFDDIIYFSPVDDFNSQLKQYGGEDKVIFKNYDHDEEIVKFNKLIKNF